MTSVLHRPQPQPLPHLVNHDKNTPLFDHMSYQPEQIQTPAAGHGEYTPIIEGDPTGHINPQHEKDNENGNTVGAIKRTTIPFLAKRQFSRFLPTTPTPGEVPYPRQQLHTPFPPPPAGLYGITHWTEAEPEPSGSSNQTSYALSKDSALADFFRGPLEVTPLPQFEGLGLDLEGYFIGWEATPIHTEKGAEGNGEGEGDGVRLGPVGCISETEAGWSRSGVKGLSSYKSWSEFGEGRKGVRGRKQGWGWFTI